MSIETESNYVKTPFDQARPLFTVQLTATVGQLQEALNAFGGDLDETEITLALDSNGKTYAWETEYPEEGVLCLDDYSSLGLDSVPDDLIHPLSAEAVIQPGDLDE